MGDHAVTSPRALAAILASAALFGASTPLARALIGGAAASVLLNLEAVFPVMLAWFAFGEHRSARVVVGMAMVVAGCTALAWPDDARLHGNFAGAAWIAAACLCWAIDNNLTRRISANDAISIAAVKGLVGGADNMIVAFVSGAPPPPALATLAAATVGFAGCGVSLVLFIVALRDLGAGRASAYYGTAPFFGVAVAVVLLAEPVGARFWAALPLTALGVWLHATERHRHRHAHEAQTHAHPHRHDEHHAHAHDFDWDGREPHVHAHTHEPLVHAHGHTPDLHHGHRH